MGREAFLNSTGIAVFGKKVAGSFRTVRPSFGMLGNIKTPLSDKTADQVLTPPEFNVSVCP